MKKNEEDEGKKKEEEFISNVGRKEQDHQGLSSSTSMMSGDKKMIGGGGSPRPSCSFHNPNIPKPQDLFNMFVNNMNQPFEHVWLQRSADGTRVIHPLENLCEADFIDRNIGSIKPINPLPMENTPFVLVEEVKELKQLAAKLNSVEEFAVDLEHNQYRSFQGMTCLMQISTRTEDFVVDTLKLRVHIGPYLREIFKDPSKRKVMHGADRDIVWLQRDFGIYVCNLFDTQQASRVLDMERNSLEYLLLYFFGVAVNKAYQIADWRVRPLPDDMLKYAREDTHYLLFLYDLMRRRLLSTSMSSKVGNDLLSEVYKRSYDICMHLYEKELLTDTSFLHIYGLQEAGFNSLQLSVVSALCEWRDNVARVEDESTGYILPNKTLLEIARQVPLTVSNLRRLVKSKHPYVEHNLDSIVDLIKGSIRNAAAFEPTAQLLKERRLEMVTGQNIEVVSTLPFQHVIDDGEVVNIGNEQTTRRSPATDEGIADSATAFYGATEEILNKASNDVGLGKSSSKSEIDADPKVIEQHIELDPTVTWQHERIDAGVGVNIVSGQNTKRYSASVHVKNEVVTARSIEVNSIVSLQSQKIDDGESVNVNGQKTLSDSGEEHPKLEREMLEHSRSSQGSSFQPLGEAEERIERECHVLDLETGSFTILRQMRGTFSDKGNTDSAKAPSGATEGALDKPSHDSEVAISMPGLKFDAGSNGKVEQMESLDVIPFQSFISNSEQLKQLTIKDREILYPQNSIGKPTGITKLDEAGSLKTCFADQEPLYNVPTEVNNGFTEKSKLDALIETISLSNLSSKLQKCFQLKLEKKNTYEKKEVGCGSQLGAFDYSKKRTSLRHGQEEEMFREGDEGFKSLLDSREGSKSSVIRRFRTDELTRRFQQERQYQTLVRAGNQI